MTATALSDRGIAEVFSHEAIVPYRYKDSVGVDTFGVGHTHNAGAPDPRKMAFAKEYPLTQVVEVFRRDMRKFEGRVRAAVKVPLKQHQFDALFSFDFNTGGVHRAQLTKSLNAGNVSAAADQFMGWVRPPEIIPRRKKEQALFRDGTYSSGGKANVYPADSKGRVLWSKGKRVDVMAAIGPIKEANAEDVKAGAEKNKAVVSGTGGAATGGASQVPVDAPSTDAPAPDPTIPDVQVDPAMVETGLIAVGVVLVVIAVVFAFRAVKRRQKAKEHNSKAAAVLEEAISRGEPSEEGETS